MLFAFWCVGLQIGLDRLVLLVKLGHVWYEILDDEHCRTEEEKEVSNVSYVRVVEDSGNWRKSPDKSSSTARCAALDSMKMENALCGRG